MQAIYTDVDEKAFGIYNHGKMDNDTKENKVPILVKVPPKVKAKAQEEADLAYSYGWIPNASVTQLFIWMVEVYLAEGIKQYIKKRRNVEDEEPAGG